MKILTLIMLLFCLQNIHAQNKIWIGGSSGTWSVASNWNPSGTPGGNDTVTINQDANIALDINLTLGSLRILNNASVTLDAPANRDVLLFGNTQSSPALLIEDGCNFTMLTSGASGAFHMAFASFAKAWINGTLTCRGNSVNGDARLEADNGGTNKIYINGTYLSDVNSGNLIGDTRNLFFNAGSVYQLNDNGGLIPNALYDSLSLIKITGTKNSQPVFLTSGFTDNYYGSILYDGSQQTADINLSISTNATYKSIVKGDFDVINTKGLNLYLATNLRNFYIQNNFTIGTECQVKLGNGSIAQMWVNGDFTLGENSTLYLNGGLNIDGNDSLSVGGNVDINGEFIASMGHLQLNGTNGKQFITQNISGRLFGTGSDLIINNPSGVELLSDLNTPFNLILKNGNIETGPSFTVYLFYFETDPEIFEASSKSYINGNLSRSISTNNRTNFPVGDGLRFRPIDVQPCCSTFGGGSGYRVTYFHNNPYTTIGSEIAKPLTGISNTEYWNVSGGLGKVYIPLDGVVTASPRDPIESDTLLIAAWSDADKWEQVYTADGIIYPGTSTIGELVSGSINSGVDRKFTIAFRADILPIRLIAFVASINNNTAHITWTTDGLESNGFFEIMKSSDSRNFVSVAKLQTVKGQANYSFIDNDLSTGIQYYKLKMTDAEGKISCSEISSVNYINKAIIKLQPNPAHQTSLLFIESETEGIILIKVFNTLGQLVQEQKNFIRVGENTITLQLQNIAVGNYQVQVSENASLLKTFQLIKR